MYADTIEQFTKTAVAKSATLRRLPHAFFVSAMMAGAYVGLGIILIFSIGSDLDPTLRPLVMGASFGIALILVVFAGSDLFTGHTMFMTLGLLKKRVSASELAASWITSWLANLVGAALLAWIFVLGGGVNVLHAKSGFIFTVAAAKMSAPAVALFARAVLCNWLVCLALWMAARMKDDAAKCIAIFWCLFAFIASGYEHSVANMTIFAVALLAEHPATITVGGMFYNLFWVTLGNIVGGAGLVGVGYWIASRPVTTEAVAAPAPAE